MWTCDADDVPDCRRLSASRIARVSRTVASCGTSVLAGPPRRSNRLSVAWDSTLDACAGDDCSLDLSAGSIGVRYRATSTSAVYPTGARAAGREPPRDLLICLFSARQIVSVDARFRDPAAVGSPRRTASRFLVAARARACAASGLASPQRNATQPPPTTANDDGSNFTPYYGRECSSTRSNAFASARRSI